jgi:hypothetical protein
MLAKGMESGALGVVDVVNSHVVVLVVAGDAALRVAWWEQPVSRPAMSPERIKEAKVTIRRVMRAAFEVDIEWISDGVAYEIEGIRVR